MNVSTQCRPRPLSQRRAGYSRPGGAHVLRRAAAGGAGEGDDTAGDVGARRHGVAGLVMAVLGAAGGVDCCHLVVMVTEVTAVAAGAVGGAADGVGTETQETGSEYWRPSFSSLLVIYKDG